MNNLKRALFHFLLFALLQPAILLGQPAQPLDASRLAVALKKLNVLGSVLYIAAHPDDENTALLAYCSNEKLLRSAYLSMTRGDGGQNLIGTEQAELLGVIRTQELLAARKIDGAEQFFTRAIDFGYSKSPEETMSIWDREKILADVVWIIRRFCPDVIITRFPDTGEGGHGHHTASAILAREAFTAAADSTRFPEQLTPTTSGLSYVHPWRAKRLLWNAWLPALQQQGAELSKMLKLDIGAYNPLLAKSYTELAAESRSMHKSQGFGVSAQRGETLNYFQLLEGDSTKGDLFEGIDAGWSRIRGGEAVGKLLAQAEKEYRPDHPSAILPILLQAYDAMEKIKDDRWVLIKKKELIEAIHSCAGMWIEAIADDYSAAPGSTVRISASVVNRSDSPMTFKGLRIAFLPNDSLLNMPLTRGQQTKIDLKIILPKNIPSSQPYWLAEKPAKGAFQIKDQSLIDLPENPPALTCTFVVRAGEKNLALTTPVYYRWTDRVEGEEYRPFVIGPPVTVNFDDKVYLFPDRNQKTIHLTLKSGAPNVFGSVRLRVPENWRVAPSSIPFSLQSKGEERSVSFTVLSPVENSTATLIAEADVNGEVTSNGVITIEHKHIPIQTLFPPAETKLVRVDIARSTKSIGYIMGSGDNIPNYLSQLGYTTTLLSDKDLDEGKFNAYDAVVVGIRAYNTRPRLKFDQAKLLAYVERGGTLVVQYNVNRELVSENLGPYPFKISNDRVTVEEAPVAFLAVDHPLLSTPNKITAQDFEGWVQERGLYFTNEWDPRYQTVLACNDPGESSKQGGLLYAEYGAGRYIYSGYAWFRQLPAGVPGAFRLFVNMIEGKASKKK